MSESDREEEEGDPLLEERTEEEEIGRVGDGLLEPGLFDHRRRRLNCRAGRMCWSR